MIGDMLKNLASEAHKELQHRRVIPRDSIGFLTYRCTSCCKTCCIWKRESSEAVELDKDAWLRVINRLAEGGVRTFELFGGDAMLRKDAIFDIVRTCRDRGIDTYFPTNSLLCDRETVRELVDGGLGTVYLSIDDVDDAHDQVRGVDGTFAKVKQALESFVELRGNGCTPSIIVCTTLSSMNFRNFPRLVRFLEQYPINAIYPRPLGEFTRANIEASAIDGLLPEPYFAPSDGRSHLMNREELREFREMITDLQKRPPRVYINWHSFYLSTDETFLHGEYPLRPCHIATTLVTVNPNGDVVPCPFFRSYVIGNLAHQELGEIWGNERHRRFIALQQEGRLPICCNCNTRPYYPTLGETVRYYRARLRDHLKNNLNF